MNFIHLRRYNGNALQSRGGATIAYFTEPAVEPGKDYLHYYTAKCCPRDVFCKDTGRKVAAGRLETHHGFFMQIDANMPRHKLREMLVEKYYEAQENFDADIREKVR